MPFYEYPRPALTADVVAFVPQRVPRVLLICRGRDPFKGCWALPGGFVNEYEAPEVAARREFSEETGLKYDGKLVFVGLYGKQGRDPRGWTVSAAYLARYETEATARAGDDAVEACWFGLDSLPPLAFDHDVIIADAARLMRSASA